ncbi:MAG: FAD-binding oxidoreductase [Gammaproteobacteria bacterium]|nr:MAG: FAD-binding oxidoreductase [Gammaproteobacteria bacterium]
MNGIYGPFEQMLETTEHTKSYYAATTNVRTDYPRLEGEHSCDIAVVGAGFTGVSTALALSERGYDVAIVEANRVGWGASGRNGGQLIDGMVDSAKIEKRLGKKAADIAYQMGVDCRDIVVANIEKYSIDCDLKFGYLDLAMHNADMKYLREEVESKHKHNYPHEVRLVEQEDLHTVIGSDQYIGGLVNPANGHLHPLNLCIGEARAAEQNGARIFEQSPVTRIVHGDKPRVETENGVLNAAKVVLAGNAYLGSVEPSLTGTIISSGSYIIATEPLDDALATELLPQDMACCNLRIGLDYYRLSADRRMLFGGLCNYLGRDPKSITATLRPKMLKVFPQLADARIDYEWGGNIAISMNRIPQMGRIQGNTYYSQGYSGHGVAPTHVAGQVLADAIGGDLERFDVFSRIKHFRLPGGKWFANPALAIGMLYYRIKDIL